MRFNAPDPAALARAVEDKRVELNAAVLADDACGVVDAAADLASMLTTARREAEAVHLIEQHLHLADENGHFEPAGWLWNAYATALQYCGRRCDADVYFGKAVEVARVHGWRKLQALALHHWGRSLVEQARFAEAELRIAEALAIRVELGEPRQESSRRALAALAMLLAKSTDLAALSHSGAPFTTQQPGSTMTSLPTEPSVSVDQLAGWLEDHKPLQVLDVRRQPAYEKSPTVIAGAQRVLPDEVVEWAARSDVSIPVVAYCVFGHEVSQGAVAMLRAQGFDACFLEGGIAKWQTQGLPTVAGDV